jgi:hypothetical protein
VAHQFELDGVAKPFDANPAKVIKHCNGPPACGFHPSNDPPAP